MISRFACAALVWIAAVSSVSAAEITAVPRILDADTIAAGSTRIRLSGVDAPETDQICLDANGRAWSCGIAAKERLESMSAGRAWTCNIVGRDLYGRQLGTCRVGNEDVSAWLVRNGWALAFRRYSSAYIADEDRAKSQKVGLWEGAFIAPWDWRRRGEKTVVLGAFTVPVGAQRDLISPSLTAGAPNPACVIKASFSRNACIYHAPGGKFYTRLKMGDTKSKRWFCSEAEAEAAGCRKSKL